MNPEPCQIPNWSTQTLVVISTAFSENFYTSAKARMKPTKLPQTHPITLRSNCRKNAEPAKRLQLSHTLDWAKLNYMDFYSSGRKGSGQGEHSKTTLLKYRETGSQKLVKFSHPMAPWRVKVESYSAVDFESIARIISVLPTADAFDWGVSSHLYQIDAQTLS